MKIALPSRKDSKYIKQKLKIFWKANLEHSNTPENERKEFNRALDRLCHFFQLPLPKILWYQKLGFFGANYLGECTADGEIHLLTPHFHGANFDAWLNTFYHEFGHYVLWADCEKKAREFAHKMGNK